MNESKLVTRALSVELPEVFQYHYDGKFGKHVYSVKFTDMTVAQAAYYIRAAVGVLIQRAGAQEKDKDPAEAHDRRVALVESLNRGELPGDGRGGERITPLNREC